MSTPESRSRIRRALRTSWHVLKSTLAPSRAPSDLEDFPLASEPATTDPPAEPTPAEPRQAPTASVPNEAQDTSVLPRPGPAAVSSTALSGAPQAGASAELLTLVQARLDLFSERLELLREQVAATAAIANAHANANANANMGTNARLRDGDEARRPARPGSLQREIGRLSERLERLERLERHDRKNGAVEELPPRAALRPPRVPTGLDLFESTAGTASGAEWDFLDGAVMGPRLTGTFQELRLATLFEVLQLERRVGTLALRTADHTIEVDLRRGSVTGVRRDGVDADVVSTIREAFRWPSADFTFRRSETVRESGAPRSIHGLMLEVVRQNDEAARTG